MPRPIAHHGEPVNGDSFLDIVASVVSIMIVMVVMEGMRIKNTPVRAAIPAALAGATSPELEKELDIEQSLHKEIWDLAKEAGKVQREAAIRGAERDLLATAIAAGQREIQERREKLGRGKRGEFDVARAIWESQRDLDQLARQRGQVENASAPPVVIESYPTPISRTVDGPEAHLLISNGRVLFIPIEPLLEQFQSQAKRQAYRLADQRELTDTVGPVGGFRLRYTLERYDISAERMRETGRGGSFVRLQRWTLIPDGGDLGEPARLALEEGSDFRKALVKILPGRTTITIWVYPDGFDAFRQIRRELYRQGYLVAARPLPPGELISGSPDGSKSAAQ